MGTVLKGSLEMRIGPEKKIVKPGEAYHIPSDVLHSGKCLEGPAEVLEVFTPRRDDLKGD
jgi:quercetin dioxygenase-like cupin family protein